MAVPVWTVGQVLSSSDVNNWLAPQAVTKPSDQSVTSSTVLVNDTALVLPGLASAVYNVTCMIDYEGAAVGTGDIKLNWTVPAGAILNLGVTGYLSTANVVGAPLIQHAASTVAFGSSGAGTTRCVILIGSLAMSTTAGNLQLQWAQNTSNGTATIVHAGSMLQFTRTS